jgi:hypothetical protein
LRGTWNGGGLFVLWTGRRWGGSWLERHAGRRPTLRRVWRPFGRGLAVGCPAGRTQRSAATWDKFENLSGPCGGAPVTLVFVPVDGGFWLGSQRRQVGKPVPRGEHRGPGCRGAVRGWAMPCPYRTALHPRSASCLLQMTCDKVRNNVRHGVAPVGNVAPVVDPSMMESAW